MRSESRPFVNTVPVQALTLKQDGSAGSLPTLPP